MAIKLVISALDNQVSEFEFDQSLITVGRSKSCHVELDSPEVSRRHFIIKYSDDKYFIVDEGSRHGTILDAKPLERYIMYPLATKHSIEVPGFLIKLFSDEERPKLERTTVVARELLDELLQDELSPRECPTLSSQDGRYRFLFVDEKTSFVLGRLSQLDFVMKEEGVASEHVSFVRDINGIRLIPLPGHDVLIDGVLVTEPQILTHNAIISFSGIDFVFRVTNTQDAANASVELKQEAQTKILDDAREHVLRKQEHAPKKRSLLAVLDRFFLLAFLLAIAGVSMVFFELI